MKRKKFPYDDGFLFAAYSQRLADACGSAGPGLNIARDGANISISWPSSSAWSSSLSREYVLEFTTSLTPPSWKTPDLTPANNNGRWEVNAPIQTQGYFRLRKP